MIETICSHIHNYFERGRIAGRFAIAGGVLALPGVAAGEYFRVTGSRFNDGVHIQGAEGLVDEVFDGEIALMRPPRAFLDLVREIAAWRERYGEGPYSSESVAGVYAYTRRDGDWQAAFANRLDAWRRIMDN